MTEWLNVRNLISYSFIHSTIHLFYKVVGNIKIIDNLKSGERITKC